MKALYEAMGYFQSREEGACNPDEEKMLHLQIVPSDDVAAGCSPGVGRKDDARSSNQRSKGVPDF